MEKVKDVNAAIKLITDIAANADISAYLAVTANAGTITIMTI